MSCTSWKQNNPNETCPWHHHAETICPQTEGMLLYQPCTQPVPPVAPYNLSTPSSLLSISCIPAWGPSAGWHCLPFLIPLPHHHSHPGRGSGCALHSNEHSTLALRRALGFTNYVRSQDASVINTNHHSMGNNNTSATERPEWLMLSIFEIWNKLAPWSDPKCVCLCHREAEGHHSSHASTINPYQYLFFPLLEIKTRVTWN